jgi:hypothetical protein
MPNSVNGMLLKSKNTNKECVIVVPWHTGQNEFWWNETCAMVLEVFGLPGHRFTYHPEMDKMSFHFNNKKDADLCRILLSERL